MTTVSTDIRKISGREEINAALRARLTQYDAYVSMGLKLDMQRGRPCAAQLDIADEALAWNGPYVSAGTDARNYGGAIEGTPEARALFAELLDAQPSEVIVWGNSSLNLMYDLVFKGLVLGVYGGAPWIESVSPLSRKPKFICPSPGYDRHFAIAQNLGFDLVTTPMSNDGPEMDYIENLVNNDASVVGCWCVPVYSNPTGVVYSNEVVRRFAALKPKNPAFRVFWDNAYFAHSLFGDPVKIINLRAEAAKAGNPHMVYEFMSTSKITFAGAGVCAMAASGENIKFVGRQLSIQSITPDKINQLRHVAYIKNADNLKLIMARHADIIRPKFEAAQEALKGAFGQNALCEWSVPKGGYFISVDTPDGCAARALKLAGEAGIRMTPAGAAFPYGVDPRDRNIRIAPTVPTIPELKLAIEVLAVCVEIAYLTQKQTRA